MNTQFNLDGIKVSYNNRLGNYFLSFSIVAHDQLRELMTTYRAVGKRDNEVDLSLVKEIQSALIKDYGYYPENYDNVFGKVHEALIILDEMK